MLNGDESWRASVVALVELADGGLQIGVCDDGDELVIRGRATRRQRALVDLHHDTLLRLLRIAAETVPGPGLWRALPVPYQRAVEARARGGDLAAALMWLVGRGHIREPEPDAQDE